MSFFGPQTQGNHFEGTGAGHDPWSVALGQLRREFLELDLPIAVFRCPACGLIYSAGPARDGVMPGLHDAACGQCAPGALLRILRGLPAATL